MPLAWCPPGQRQHFPGGFERALGPGQRAAALEAHFQQRLLARARLRRLQGQVHVGVLARRQSGHLERAPLHRASVEGDGEASVDFDETSLTLDGFLTPPIDRDSF